MQSKHDALATVPQIHTQEILYIWSAYYCRLHSCLNSRPGVVNDLTRNSVILLVFRCLRDQVYNSPRTFLDCKQYYRCGLFGIASAGVECRAWVIRRHQQLTIILTTINTFHHLVKSVTWFLSTSIQNEIFECSLLKDHRMVINGVTINNIGYATYN